jgi:hypothetical protein
MLQRSVPNVFGRIVASVFLWMLHTFHTYVASVFIWILRMLAMVFKCFMMFLQVFKHALSVSFVFFCILQELHLNVLKVDLASTADFHLVGVDQISCGVSCLQGG